MILIVNHAQLISTATVNHHSRNEVRVGTILCPENSQWSSDQGCTFWIVDIQPLGEATGQIENSDCIIEILKRCNTSCVG